jgi:hypothetical protein
MSPRLHRSYIDPQRKDTDTILDSGQYPFGGNHKRTSCRGSGVWPVSVRGWDQAKVNFLGEFGEDHVRFF